MKQIFYTLFYFTFAICAPLLSLHAQWVQTNGPYGGTIYSFAVSPDGTGGTNLFAGTWGAGVFLSTDNGTSWSAVNSGLTNYSVMALAVSPVSGGTGGTNLFAGTYTYGVWRRLLSEMIPTGVDERQEQIPYRFALEQNYPNPFNPSTIINYQLAMNSHVTLKVYDILGREVATLVNEEKPAGSYSVQWNAGGVASGVYFYKLEAGSFSATRRLMLIK